MRIKFIKKNDEMFVKVRRKSVRIKVQEGDVLDEKDYEKEILEGLLETGFFEVVIEGGNEKKNKKIETEG